MDLGDCLDILVSRVNEVLADPATASALAGIEAVGLHLWESSGEARRRSELLHAHAPAKLVRELSSLLLIYIGYAAAHASEDSNDCQESVALARAAEISMGILCNLVADSRTAAPAWTTVLHIINSADSARYPWTSHAPLAAAMLQCLAMLCSAEATKSSALEYMHSHVDVWMQFMLSGKADVALWSARLMYTCAASGPTMQQVLHDGDIMLVIEKLLESATSQTCQEVDTDSHAVVATCELLDILLDAETMTLDETGIQPTQKLSRIDGDSTVQLASESGEAKPAPIKTNATHPEVETDDPGDSKEQKASLQHATDPADRKSVV